MKIKLLVYILLLITVVFYAYTLIESKYQFGEQQKNIAATIGVPIEKYPYFPNDYFSEVLKPGMSLDQVHKFVLGYEKVFNYATDISYYEMYYYITDNQKTINSLMIIYNKEYLVRKIIRENVYKENHNPDEWDEGLLEKE